ncbi:MAG: hypothetical protein GXY15_16595 [Candidatus Hydrogenedentes bacterium]|nr:hypothetical protein [Candidatus Hydrogenedentota bacterium]
MKQAFLALSALLCVAGLVGCQTGDSGDYPTDQISCTFTVDVNDVGVTARASFWTTGTGIGPVNLILTAGDTVTVNGVAMPRRNGVATDFYQTALDPAEQYTFTFTRGDGTALTGTVDTLVPLAVTAPAADASVSRAADLAVNWTNPIADGLATVTVSGEYLQGIMEDVADTGAYTVPAGTLVLDADAPTSSVQGWVTISRNRLGVMDPGLAGTVAVTTSATVRFTSTE